MRRAWVCVRAGEDTITHHVDRALGRSLLGREESEENRFNEQVTERSGEAIRGNKTEKSAQ